MGLEKSEKRLNDLLEIINGRNNKKKKNKKPKPEKKERPPKIERVRGLTKEEMDIVDECATRFLEKFPEGIIKVF